MSNDILITDEAGEEEALERNDAAVGTDGTQLNPTQPFNTDTLDGTRVVGDGVGTLVSGDGVGTRVVTDPIGDDAGTLVVVNADVPGQVITEVASAYCDSYVYTIYAVTCTLSPG